jgi:hypothetical protein
MPMLPRRSLQELIVEELGLTMLEQMPQLKVAIHLVKIEPVFMWHRLSTQSCTIGHHPNKISLELLPDHKVTLEAPVSMQTKSKATDVEACHFPDLSHVI